MPTLTRQSRYILLVVLGAWFGLVALPWYGVAHGFWSFSWLADPIDPANGSGLVQALLHGRFWLWPLPLLLIVALIETLRRDGPRAGVITWLGGLGLGYLLLQGLAIGLKGWTFASLESLLGPVAPQIGFGGGAFVVGTAFLLLLSAGLALKGFMRGDVFLVSSIAAVVASIGLFVFFPVALILIEAAQRPEGGYALGALVARFYSADLWAVTWNSLILAIVVGLLTTLLGLGFALLHKRTDFRAKGLLRLLAILPIITPPFVIGLGIILLFGRNGIATWIMAEFLGIPPSRWIYGFFGLVLVQTLAFTPIAYLVLIGVVDGISPSMEEAARTLRADRWRTFRTVTWPLMRPGLANAFLIGFVESLADFGNPLVLGGNYDVLATDIFFAIVGSQNDPGRASALSIALLFLTLSAFVLQRQWIGRKVYTTIAGKGDAGLPAPLPDGVRRLVYWTTMPWFAFTILLYGIILIGGFLKSLGIDNTPTLQHYITAFGIDWTEHGLLWSGRAWPSFFTTIELAAIAAPLTAIIGLLTAYLLNRQRFIGQSAFEFITMLSFAIPGTVIGVSYILAFNVPPIELTGTGLILVICFVFRNMPVSIRAGLATLAQIDKSLDECSLVLRHGSFATIRRVILPLLRPAIMASLVYAFVRAITSVSAVIFLVSAQYNLATAYIVGRVEVSDFGVAIAYSSVLILFMLATIGLIQLGVGRRAARRGAPAALGMGGGTT
ncbi:iron ABC transporter permease [Nordella sp. HKS 07]|uniref:ABC transporter permease n=1 Tax=Nordella sp. HKS 07 TaxID=2712222 RepID=UPI0013E12899|nr:iron ABC transporter permease [Nordella sp. HKS 07]QIG49690.1 iron ABC transporter permease [Nordella sp. HKS 07]